MLPLPQITIRCARPDDLPTLRTLAATAVRRLCAADQTRAQIETILRFAGCVDPRLVEDRTYYVVEHAGRLIGAGGWSYRAALFADGHPDDPGQPHDVLDAAVHPARLRGFFVDPGFARRGIARTLCALCQGAAARAGFTAVELLAGPTARPLYLACGFTVEESVTHIFPNGVAAVGYRMTKALEPICASRPSAPDSHKRVTSAGSRHENLLTRRYAHR